MSTEIAREFALKRVVDERVRQDKKWGKQDHSPIEWLAVLAEEVGEYSQEVLREGFAGVKDKNLPYEMVQVAAVAVACIECAYDNSWEGWDGSAGGQQD